MDTAGNIELIDRFQEFYRECCRDEIGELAQRYPNDQKSLYVDWTDLQRFDPDLADDYRTKPEQVQEYAEEALRLYELPVEVSLGQAHVRIRNLPNTEPIRDLRHEHHGNLIAIQGTVRGATDVRPKVIEAAFECQRCGTLTRIPQTHSDFQEPHECQGCERQGPFRLNTNQSQFIDGQQLRIQESYAGLRGGEDPQYVDVYIEDDITGTVTAGEQVTINGILKLDQQSDGQKQSSRFDLYIDGLSLEAGTDAYAEMTLSDDTREKIVSQSAEPDIYEQLIDSIAPSVHDNETIKLGILLQLFGGIDKEFPDGAQSRGNIHTLLVGPSNGTVDRLVERGASVAPRAVSISGTETTAAGLTAAATPSSDAPGDDPWTLKAGAIVMADHGLLGLHEAGALSNDALAALGRTLDAQEVQVSKASQTQSLRANTAVLAAGTPSSGGFDQYQPLRQQIGLTPELVSQFDLVFTITDDDVDDADVADHLIDVARAAEGAIGMEHEHGTPPKPKSETASFPAPDEFAPPVGGELLRQYAVFARQHCFPAITDAAKERLTEFYVQVRKEQSDEPGPLAVTEQTLESLIRLTEASARVRLADMAEKADAERAIELMEASLEDTGAVIDSGELDAETIVSGEVEDASDEELVLSMIKELETSDQGASPEKLLTAGIEAGLSKAEVKQALKNVKQRGKVYRPEGGGLRST